MQRTMIHGTGRYEVGITSYKRAILSKVKEERDKTSRLPSLNEIRAVPPHYVQSLHALTRLSRSGNGRATRYHRHQVNIYSRL